MADFSNFNITDATYKEVDGTDIDLTILTSKDLKSGKYPLIVRFHGGFLITGSRMYKDWFPKWLLANVQKIPSILLTPDYRLLPESTGTDILSDLTALFTWITKSLPFTLSSLGLSADLSSILTVGESAGGYLAIQSALLHPEMGIKAAISQYGVLDVRSRFFTEDYEKVILGTGMHRRKVLDEHVKAIKEGEVPRVQTGVDPPGRLELSLTTVQHGRYVEVLGEETELFPMENLERAERLPAMWLTHGREDSAVPVAGSQAFYDKVKQLHPNADVKLTIEPGEHGFDGEATLETPWMKEGLDWVGKFWP